MSIGVSDHRHADEEYRALERAARHGTVSARPSEPLLHQDMNALDGLIAEAIKSQDVLYAYVTMHRTWSRTMPLSVSTGRMP
jgi:hypothetical protein